MNMKFTRAERQIITMLKVLSKIGILTKNELEEIAGEYITLTMIVNGKSPRDIKNIETSNDSSLKELGVDEEDVKWFMTLMAMADPDKAMRTIGFKDLADLRRSVENE